MTGKENLEKLRRLNFDADQILEAKKQKKKKTQPLRLLLFFVFK